MQIKLETVTLPDGSEVHDLVLVQGTNTIRLGMIADDAQEAMRELVVWLEYYTMDLVEIMSDSKPVQTPATSEGGAA